MQPALRLPHYRPGYFIALEGGNGSGKSTAISVLARTLEDDGFDVVLTREPGGTPLGEQVRAIVLDPKNSNLSPHAGLLLFAAARAQHFQDVIEPALEQGKIVLCDRFIASTIAFQGHAQGLDHEAIDMANLIAVGPFLPDLNVVLDVDPAVGMQRMAQRGALDRFDAQAAAFHEKARQGFLVQASEHPEEFLVVDATPAQEVVLHTLIKGVNARLREVLQTFPDRLTRRTHAASQSQRQIG